jgi:hypothetical protein
LTFADTDGNDFSSNTNFTFTGVENVNISALTAGAITINSAQLAANPTFTLTGNATADNLTVVGKSATAGNTIDASGITVSSASVTLQGNAKDDTITGTAFNDTINQTIGSDTIIGGAGTDKFVSITLGANVKDSTAVGADDIAGQVFNFGASAVTASQVATKLGTYLSLGVSSVTTGKTAYTFANEKVANSANQQTISTVESFVGTSGKDYFVASDAGMTFEGAGGNDYVILGGGNDIVKFADTASNNGIDEIVNFLAAGTDKLDFTAFLGAAATVNTTAFDIAGTTGSVLGVTNVAVAFNKTGASLTAADFQTTTGAGKIAIEDNSKAVILVTADADGTSDTTVTPFNIYYVQDTNTDTGATDQTWSVTLVGTLVNTTELSAAALAAAAAYV